MGRSYQWEDFQNLAAVGACREGPATAEEISELRRRLGFNRADFARVVGVGGEVIREWEEGTRRPTPRSRRRLAAAARREVRPPLLRR
jgi:DNA-binding transcriptional regulator YiaG